MVAHTTLLEIPYCGSYLFAQDTENRLLLKVGECTLKSNLQGKASRKLVASRGLPIASTCVLIALPGKLYIKRRIRQLTHWFTLQNGDYNVISDFCIDSTPSTLLKK